MQRLLVFVLSISLALASAHRPSPNPNAKRSSEWEGQNYDRDVHEDSVRRSLSEVELGQPKVPPNAKRAPFNWGSHDDTSRNFRRNKPRAGPSITIPLVRRGHHRPFRSGLLSAKELEENAEVTDLNAIQAARDALIDKYTESEGAKRRLRDRRKRRDEMSALLEKEKAKAKRIIKDIAITNNNFDTVYSANLLLGTPAQSFSILLDTGSSDTWVTAPNCTCTSQGCSSCVSGSSWDPSTSSTYSRRGAILQISYGSGVVNGWTGEDVASLGGFTVEDQVIGIVDSAARVLPGDVEGLMGLAFGRITRADGTPWWLRVLAGEGGASVDAGVMSFWLSRYIGTTDTSQIDNPGGQFILGGTNSSLYTGDITYTPVIQPAKWWLISLSSVGTQGGSSIDVAQNASYSIIDTGTTLVGGHDIVVDGIFSAINGSVKGETIAPQMTGFYAVPCDTTTVVTFTFSGTTFTMSSRDLLYMRIDDQRPNYCLASLFTYSSMDVHSIDYKEPNTPYWLIGDSFLKNVYSVFDLGSSWSTGDGTQAGVQGMGNLGTTAQVGFAALSGVNGEIGMAVQTDDGGGNGNGTMSGGATSTANESTLTALPIGVIPDVLTTVVVVTATADGPANATSTSGAIRQASDMLVVVGLLSATGMALLR